MGLFDRSTQQDTSTPEERRAWRDRAKEQMAEQKRQEQGSDRTSEQTTHRRARRPQ